MRIAEAGEDLTGCVCISSLGRVGVVAKVKYMRFEGMTQDKPFHVGMGLDGKGLWASSYESPTIVLAKTLDEYTEMIRQRPSSVLYATPAVPKNPVV